MVRRFGRALLLGLLALAVAPVSSANAQVAPPWCGTPEPDAAANLPDETDPEDPPAGFPHIPYYAVGCTLRDIERRSRGRMDVDVIGESALGRPMYSVVINELRTRKQRSDYRNWQAVRSLALRHPRTAQRLLERFDDDVKVPIFVQGGIHGDEYEGVDAAMMIIEKYATTPYGQDPAVDEVLDHAVLVFNPIQNPDGRVAGTRQNGNGFDLNRDYLTQSQSETVASVELMKEWLPPEVLDLHGYVSPTLIEATTKPHNPSIEYDLWLKWNQSRIDANEADMNAAGWEVTRPINDWCPEAEPANEDGLCDGENNEAPPPGGPPGPDVAEGWDDWGPFYTAMYAQHLGLDSSTVEMCEPFLDEDDGEPVDPDCGGRTGSRDVQRVIQESTFDFVVANREEMLYDELEIYRRGDEDAPRPACCPDPFKPEFHNWMLEYPKAYLIPLGEGQRSDAEANRLVRWLLFNDIEVTELERDYRYAGVTYEEGSYVAWLAQPRRGLLDTALSIGVDISPRINRLYAPPAAWSHGYLWGADVVTVPDAAQFSPRTDRISRPNRIEGGVERSHRRGKKSHGDGYTLEIDSPTAVRALNELVAEGVDASMALEAFSGGAAGTAIFGDDRRTERELDDVGEDYGLVFRRLRGEAPATEPLERVPRFRVITGSNGTAATDQSTWVLRQLGFEADPITIQQVNELPTDPLAGYDVIYNVAAGYPSATGQNPRPVARARLAAFFAAGGGYIGGQQTGVRFLRDGAQTTGLDALNAAGSGRSGILYWDNTGGVNSVITGVYPARDTLIADPPTWLSAVPASFQVDARLPASGFFAAGLWPSPPATVGGAALIAHGPNTANTARLAVFANNPLYRADPEREWPMVGTAAYWADGS
jgi:hypothetical protein